MKQYVDRDQLEEILRQYVADPAEVLDSLDMVSASQAAGTLSVNGLRDVLESNPDVFAVQIWQREDVVAAVRAEGLAADSGQVDRIMAEAGRLLSDCSDNWDKLSGIVRDVMKGA